MSLAPEIVSRVMSEIRSLVRKPLDDIEFVENEDNSVTEIHCYIHGPVDTPYHGGKFRVKLVLHADYPNTPPKGYFLTKIYHPNVSNNGDICVNTLKRDWKSDVTIGHIFAVIRCLLIIPFPESSLNDEAGKLFMESFDEFAKRARIMTEVHSIPVDVSSSSKTITKAKSNSKTTSNTTAVINEEPVTVFKVADHMTQPHVTDENSNENLSNKQVVKPIANTIKKTVKDVGNKKKNLKRL